MNKILFALLPLILCLFAPISYGSDTTIQTYFNDGRTKADAGDYLGAITDFDAALKLNPTLQNVYYNRGLAKTNLGDKEGAILDFSRAIDLNENDAKSYYHRAIIKATMGNYKEALDDMNEAKKLGEPDAQTAINVMQEKLKKGGIDIK
ncbi:MAG: tetratricopeptide repeat protein [Lentisphaerota bacterium]